MNIEALNGVFLSKVSVEGHSDEVLFFVDGNSYPSYRLYHQQGCCEDVSLDEIHGDLDDLKDAYVIQAEEVSSGDLPARRKDHQSYTWTFYKIQTNKGAVTLKFYGSSNGYYSESMTFERMNQ